MNVDKMRRYAERAREAAAVVEANRERADWLAAMTPEHRALHERRRPLLICGECVHKSLEPLRRMQERAAQRQAAQRSASSERVEA